MDWTGGTRRRFTKGKYNSVVQKQKEHFARARAAQHQQDEHLDWPGNSVDALASRQHRPTMASSQSANIRHHPTSSKASRSCRREADHAPSHSRGPSHTSRMALPPMPAKSSRLNPNVTDEERLLLANRKRLLARSDWLGLAASRPARIKFPTPSDKDRVGKRRKISKSTCGSHRPKPARRRSITPLFEHRLPPFEPMMSGALADDEIQVKVGTDAFVSQSQVSHPAVPLANTSMRQPSTEFGPLSEESMLLGVDDDGFEIDANGQYLGVIGSARTLASGSEYGQAWSVIQSVDDFASPTNSIAPTFATTHQGMAMRDDIQCVSDAPDQGALVAMQSCLSHDIRDPEAQSVAHDVEAFDPAILQPEPMKGTPSTDVDPEEDERRWRRAMRIPEPPQMGKTSIAALRSSSEHVTESVASAWPVRSSHEASDREHAFRTGSANPRPRRLEDQVQDHASHDTSNGRPAIADVLPATVPPQQADDQRLEPDDQVRDDEALWRDFILGKGRSESDCSEHEDGVWAAEQGEAVQRASQSTSSRVGIEQARSDQATLGDSIFASARLSENNANGPLGDQYEKSHGHTTTSMVGHATVVDCEEDEIDDVYPDDSVSRAVGNTNVARSVSMLNPRRFRPQKPPTSSSQEPYNPHRFKIRAVEKSVW
ncbi:hypothetical protein M409DRAFT_16774 [Zasmidium cellare ATCC 36951]|uniref:Uncharacterized protein n=1 Tax=Zasmidium cellare ATCC 36951 TaxID=1080233 RepID=A0A6A6D0W8_ZASCE|nr:uncharacterized protein M409DRAFT_16774 [Zasmidium cellare ATCC 36951]KAF2172815.1 hypothetical protein M409DRAFT_16774 [Zasmidium cellare ATCC 36951]